MKCGKLSKCPKNELKSGVYPSVKHFFDLLNFPLGLKRILNHFRVQGGEKLVVCGLDHSTSIMCLGMGHVIVKFILVVSFYD